MKKILFAVVMVSIVLSSIVGLTFGSTEKAEAKDEFLAIGETLDLNYVQHITDNEYQIGYVNFDDELIWKEIESGSEATYKVKIKENIETAYIKRIKDKKYGALLPPVSRYVIYLPENYNMGAGTIVEHGESGTTTTGTEMIYQR